MEAIIEKDKELSNWVGSYYNTYKYVCDFYKPMDRQFNLETFKDAISKLKGLKERNIIDDKQFSDVLIIIATNFIENEVEVRINNKINKSICTFFDK